MMLLMRRIAQSCTRAIKERDVCQKLFSKYRHALNFTLTDAAEWLGEMELYAMMEEIGEVIDERVLFLGQYWFCCVARCMYLLNWRWLLWETFNY